MATYGQWASELDTSVPLVTHVQAWLNEAGHRNRQVRSFCTATYSRAGEATGTDIDGLVTWVLLRARYDEACSSRFSNTDRAAWVTYANAAAEVVRAYSAATAPVVTQLVQTAYQRSASAPTTPLGPAQLELPPGWLADEPEAAIGIAVWGTSRTVTLHDGAFSSATAWSTPTVTTPALAQEDTVRDRDAAEPPDDDFDDDLSTPNSGGNQVTKYGGTQAAATAASAVNVLANLPIRTLYEPARVVVAACVVTVVDPATNNANLAVQANFDSGDKTILQGVPVAQVVVRTSGAVLAEPMVIFDGIVPAGTLVLEFVGATTADVDWWVGVG